MNDWQPIETAPPNTWVLIWTGGRVAIGIYRKAGYWRADNGTEHYPTRWMPLPEPPEGQ